MKTIELSLNEVHLIITSLKGREFKAKLALRVSNRNKSLDKSIKEEIEDLNTLIDRLGGNNMILDSGNRTKYETGAVRDTKEGKGRCDLMPLDVVSRLMDNNVVIGRIYTFQNNNSDLKQLYSILYDVGINDYAGLANMILDVSVHFEEGARKYGEMNWQRGIPIQSYIDSSIRHYLKYLRGDIDENHLRAFVWNILCCIWTVKHIGKEGSNDSEI